MRSSAPRRSLARGGDATTASRPARGPARSARRRSAAARGRRRARREAQRSRVLTRTRWSSGARSGPILSQMKRLLGLALLAALAGCGGDDTPVSKDVRARGIAWQVAPQDRGWIEAALKQARPEAASLIDDVDGMVTIT